MPKNLFQDMVKVKRQRIRPNKSAGFTSDPIPKEPNPPAHSAPKDRHRYMLWGVAIISIIFFLFALSFMFLKVVVKVNPKVQAVTLNQDLSASLDAVTTDALPFHLIAIPGEEEKIVQATGQKDVSLSARGRVLIYNAFSSKTQRLDIDTRLEGSNGKIYKTERQVVVPGMQGNVPGSVEVGIYGANAGAEYNSDPLDFTIFGFKGTPKYSKFYARSKGPIAGGFKGKTPVISDEEKKIARNDLKNILQFRLFQKATSQIPSGLILFKGSTYLDIEEDELDLPAPSLPSEDGKFPIKVKGTLYGLLFDEGKLTKKIAENKIKDFDGSPVYISNIRDLSFALLGKDNASFADVKNINFNLKGATRIVWKLDEGKFLSDLLGKSKKDFRQLLAQYPNIESADLTISPFWKISLPEQTKDIKLIINYPK